LQREVAVGAISRTHGLRGELTVVPYLPDPTYYERIGDFYIKRGNSLKEVKLERVRTKGEFLLLKFFGLDTIEAVQEFKGSLIVVERESIGEAPEGEYFYFDLIGLKAVSNDGLELGSIEDIIETPAGQIFVINRDGTELLVPAAPELVEKVDRDRGTITLNLLEGMIDDT